MTPKQNMATRKYSNPDKRWSVSLIPIRISLRKSKKLPSNELAFISTLSLQRKLTIKNGDSLQPILQGIILFELATRVRK
jgi:hypothetical protein